MVGRYPASLSRTHDAGPSRPQRPVSTTSSIDDEVPAAPELPPLPHPEQQAIPHHHQHHPQQPLPELASLEFLLRQAGYKETRVFTPEAERVRPRLKTRLDDDESAELANMYAAMGLDPDASIQVRHMTQPAVPFRSSSSVLRNVALQDATAMLNEVRRRRGAGPIVPEAPKVADAFWRPDILDRAAAEAVGRNVAAISPPRNRNSTDGVGLGLAQQGRGVRKAKSNMELVRKLSRSSDKEDIPPEYHVLHREHQPPTAPAHTTAFKREVPPSIAAMFSPPTMTPPDQPQFVDDAFNWGQLPSDYETQEDDDMYAEMYGGGEGDSDSIVSGSTPGTSPSLSAAEAASPPLLDTEQVFADLGMAPCSRPIETDDESLADSQEIAQAEAEAAAIGQRILASTVEYDDDDSEEEFHPDSSPTPITQPVLPLPVINVMSPSPPSRTPALEMSPSPPPRSVLAKRPIAARAAPPIRTPRRIVSRTDSLAEAMSESLVSPPKLAKPVVAPASPLRASKSVPVLRKKKSLAPFVITPAALAAPALQTVTPVLCDSVSNDAEDLPPLPIPPMNDEPTPSTSFGSLALRARKSLGALRASFWAAAPQEQPQASSSAAPILAPRLDWATQGNHFAGWNTDQDEKQSTKRGSIDSTSSMGTVHELGDPFDDCSQSIDYTKSFFYKPTTPPRPSGAPSRMGKLNKQASVKSLRKALLIPVAAPPVPKIPAEFLNAAKSTPPQSPRLPVPPVIHIHSPGAIEEGRPPRPLSLDGEEWEGHDVVPNWGEGVTRKGKGRSKKRLRKRIPFDDDYE